MSSKISQQLSGTDESFPPIVMPNKRSRISDDFMIFVLHGVLDFFTSINKSSIRGSKTDFIHMMKVIQTCCLVTWVYFPLIFDDRWIKRHSLENDPKLHRAA